MLSLEWYFQGLSRDGSCSEIQSILKNKSHTYFMWSGISVSGLAKKFAGHQGLQLKKVVGPDKKL